MEFIRKACFALISCLLLSFALSSIQAQANECGNGVLAVGEQCDDGGVLNGDGCSSTCRVEWGYSSCGPDALPSCGMVCGDGIKVSSESCDDGNTINGDGCSASCEIESSLSFNCAMQNDQNKETSFLIMYHPERMVSAL